MVCMRAPVCAFETILFATCCTETIRALMKSEGTGVRKCETISIPSGLTMLEPLTPLIWLILSNIVNIRSSPQIAAFVQQPGHGLRPALDPELEQLVAP